MLKLKKLLKHSIGLLLLSSCSGNWRDVAFKKYNSSVFKIFIETLNGPFKYIAGGTAFQTVGLSGKQYLITNAHVCDIMKGLDIKVSNARYGILRTKIIKSDPEVDLCALEPIKGVEPLSLTVFPILDEAEEIFIIGYPGLRGKAIFFGNFLTSQTSPLLISNCYFPGCFGTQPVLQNQFTVSLIGGSSGSPVFNKYGYVVSIIYSVDPRALNWSNGISSLHLIDFLNKLDAKK